MKLTRPYSGPDSYDVRTDGHIVTMAVSCVRRAGTGVAALVRVYGELLWSLAGGGPVITQLQSHRWQRRSDRRRLGGSLWIEAKPWLASRAETQDGFLEVLEEFWIDKELRVYGGLGNVEIGEAILDEWYHRHLADFDAASLNQMQIVADEIWESYFVVFRTGTISAAQCEAALGALGERTGGVFQRDPEPFEGYLP